jgi:hypothetical protein
MAVLWLLLLPGIIVHELSHWLMARAVGLKTGKLRLWPQLKGKEIVLGSVEVQKSNVLLDSLVGLAPFLGGTLVLLLIGYLAFDAGSLGMAWESGAWDQFFEGLLGLLTVPDSWLWLFLLVAVSNAMMPSPTDSTSFGPILLYLAIVSGVFILVGGIPTLSDGAVRMIAAGFRTLVYAFGLTLLVDLLFALAVGLVEFGLGLIRGTSVEYR